MTVAKQRASAWSGSTADSWDQGVIAGTGVVGAVIWGAPEHHRLALAHERFFLPANSRKKAPHLAPVLPGVRAALAAGDSAAAADIVDARLREIGYGDELIWTDPLAPCGELSVHTTGAWQDYRRDISLNNGDAGVSWGRDGQRSGLRVLTLHGESGLTLELWSQGGEQFRIAFASVAEHRASGEGVGAVDYGEAVDVTTRFSADELELRLDATGPEAGFDASVTTRVLPTRAAVVFDGDGWKIAIAAGESVQLHIAIGVHGDSGLTEPTPTAELMLGRSALQLDTVALGDQSVEQTFLAAKAGDALAERAVVELAYAAGRRNIVASTGALPATLQGVWQGTWSPAWSADYTLNGNVQNGTLASVIWTGAPELAKSYFRLVLPHLESYRDNAALIFGLEGLMLPARMTTHGNANHFIRSYPHQFWASHGGWFLRFACDYVITTGDRTIVDAWLWEFTQGVLAFTCGLIESGDGHFTPSYSPENVPHATDNPLSVDATMDIAVASDALRIGLWLATVVGDHSPTVDRWRAALTDLPAYRLSGGELAEWADAAWPDELAHRHASHLYPLWYDVDPAFVDPALRAAAGAAVRAKIAWRAVDPTPPPGRMEMAFGLVQLGLAAAALGDARSAYQCAQWLARDHFTAGLVSTHDAATIFNLDASGGLPAVVAAMLVGSSLDEIRLLQALPDEWPSGRITGLAARGGVVVDDLRWRGDTIDVRLSPTVGSAWLRPQTTRVVLPRDIDSVEGAVVEADGSLRLDLSGPVSLRIVLRPRG